MAVLVAFNRDVISCELARIGMSVSQVCCGAVGNVVTPSV